MVNMSRDDDKLDQLACMCIRAYVASCGSSINLVHPGPCTNVLNQESKYNADHGWLKAD